MSDSKQVKIGVDASEYESNLQRIKSSAEDLAREMISSSRAYSMSSKDVLRDIEDQIKAIEKRNKLESEFRRESIKESRSSGQINEIDYKKQIRESVTESKQDAIQTQLLRDVIEAIKSTAKEEVRADRENIERQLAKDKNVGRLSPEGDEKEILKRTIQRGLIPEEIKPEEDVREKGLRFQNVISSVRDGVNAVVQSENKYVAGLNVAGLAAKAMAGSATPGLASAGVIAEAAVNASLKSVAMAKEYEDVVARNYAIDGRSMLGLGLGGDYISRKDKGRLPSGKNGSSGSSDVDVVFSTDVMTSTADGVLDQIEGGLTDVVNKMTGRGVRDMTAYGYNVIEVGREKEKMSRAMGSSRYSSYAAEDSLILQRMGIDSGGQMETLLRGSGSGQMDLTKKIMRSMQGTGMIKDGDTSLVPEYLQQIVGISNQQLTKLGSIDMGTNVRVAGAISGLSNNIALHPALMSQVRAGLEGGLSEGGSPQMQALKYQLLSQEGMTSMADMNRVMESPFSEFGIKNAPNYVSNMVNFARQTSGGNKDRERLQLKGIFPALSQAIIDDVLMPMDTDKFAKDLQTDPDSALKKLGVSPIDIEGRTKGQRKQGESGADFANTFITTGMTIVEKMEDMLKALGLSQKDVTANEEQLVKLIESNRKLQEAVDKNTREKS